MNPLLEFYTNNGTDNLGRTLNKIQAFNYQQLEEDHHYIQWLFPLAEPSQYDPKAPVMDPATLDILIKSCGMLPRLINSYHVMLDFYGFYSINAEFVNFQANFHDREYVWVKPDNHNYRRITRILKSVRLFKLPTYSGSFFSALETLYKDRAEAIGPETFNYWKKTQE